ncbi:MAG: 2OG-Fe(II) oxygenase [Flavobacteriales bacterium]|jgi:Rps23 Pro-64 3,4-dihydroxylase Tpa1-like proline 4-hydroxylase|nr:2OG-Fe(II) oxygenase [Flavobacteriales bacterium]NCG30914.1 2OG-Fe(II) oxygenase [Bacteroidota bacterium]MBT3964393.1 2OG-Fe(II) oxygenase [Flavobacteriales bacterium]MBT4705831.1 2OG-Fe(II) oxygenase [Flavobacteriales bacterium]MBT4931605.1 2OG-Fe(II) oxygenase [Flavobacteriales bacterium]
MKYIDLDFLEAEFDTIQQNFNSGTPFRWCTFDGIFKSSEAELVLNAYPAVEDGKWDGTTYLDQKNKFQKTKFESGSVFDAVFAELNSDEFLGWLQRVTKLEDKIIGDANLFGGGLHQSINGAFLNVHVDYNIHPETQFHRRLNTIVYMNKEWKDEYNGHLELWDLSNNNKVQIAQVAPEFNRCVMFETNEISFHGHPKPLNTPEGINRKSLATYYYTKTRPESEIAQDHNTIYVNTEGVAGSVKRITSGVKALLERINKK